MAYVSQILEPFSIPEKTYFRKISLSLEAARFIFKIGSSAADVLVKFQSDTTIYSTNLVASWLYEILRKDVFSDIETGPRIPLQYKESLPVIWTPIKKIIRWSYHFTEIPYTVN